MREMEIQGSRVVGDGFGSGRLRRWARLMFRRAVLRLLRVSVAYSPNTSDMLAEGRCLVTCNHVSLLDGVIVALASPHPLMFAVDTDFSRRSAGAVAGLRFLEWMGYGQVVPMDARSPFGMRKLQRSICAGANVMLFPEGKISLDGKKGADQPGVSWLMQRAQARELQLAIQGAERSRLFAKSGRSLWPKISLRF